MRGTEIPTVLRPIQQNIIKQKHMYLRGPVTALLINLLRSRTKGSIFFHLVKEYFVTHVIDKDCIHNI